ncbi:MAG: hypothetical protein GWO11_03670 [Desulfuromonadales bacterium]|nr:hypothetical protein [Desulfuromonadales bacterium]NIR33540.1 hypothetical protein [Desulfuromonadales bacterium]NIS41126.1 hypothetical protein [Desulfuromonadales bacterium]
MEHKDYRYACARREHKDLPVELKNIKTGEIGTLIQCSEWDSPEGLLVNIGQGELTTWYPEEVQEVKTKS